MPIKFRIVPVDAATMVGGTEGCASTHADAPCDGHYVFIDADSERLWAEAVGSGAGRGGGRAAATVAVGSTGAFSTHYYPATASMPPSSRITFRPPFTADDALRVVPRSPSGGRGTPAKIRSLSLWSTCVPSQPGETRLVIAMAVPPPTGWTGLLCSATLLSSPRTMAGREDRWPAW